MRYFTIFPIITSETNVFFGKNKLNGFSLLSSSLFSYGGKRVRGLSELLTGRVNKAG